MLKNKLEIQKKIKKLVNIPVVSLKKEEDIQQKVNEQKKVINIFIKRDDKKKKAALINQESVGGTNKQPQYTPNPKPISREGIAELKNKIREKKVAVANMSSSPVGVAVEVGNTNKMKKLIVAPNDKCFWTTNSEIIQDLTSLQDVVSRMSDEHFENHVNSEKNDFSDWVEKVLGDTECALDIKNTKSKKSFLEQLDIHLKKYNI